MPADEPDTGRWDQPARADGISARYTAFLVKYGASPELIRRARNARVDGDTSAVARTVFETAPSWARTSLQSEPDKTSVRTPLREDQPTVTSDRVGMRRAWWERPAALAGADPDLLRDLPASRARYTTLGIALLVSALSTIIAVTFAVMQVMRVNLVIGVLIGSMIGAVTLVVERAAVVSIMTRGRKRGTIGKRALVVLPQIILALVLSVVVAVPVMLTLFTQEIEAELAVMRAEQFDATYELASTPLDEARADLVAAQQHLAQVRAQLDAEYAKPEANRSPQNVRSLSDELTMAEQQVQQADNDVSRQSAVRNDVMRHVEVKDSSSGLLPRLIALNRLLETNSELTVVGYVLFFLFVSIELLPLLSASASLQSTNAYDLMTQVREQYHVRERELALLRQTGRQELNSETALTALEERIASVEANMNREHENVVGKVTDLDARRRAG